jgi:thiosulfate dehydrogenase [quinone] large subunit
MTTTGRSTAAHLEHVEAPGSMLTKTAAKALAVLRISTGFVFLWAFLDKTFGLGYATPAAKAWIHGGSPTKGFLSSVDVGPFQGTFHDLAGTPVANWLFMLGLLGIGVALIAGIGMRIAAGAATLMMAMMWLAEYPLAQHTSAGKPSGSSNPIVDYHFIYAVGAIVLALTYAGHTWGLGRWWAQLPFVQRHRWLI